MSTWDNTKYKKEDFRQITWNEYVKVMDNVYKKVDFYLKAHNIKISAVVPILRGGGVAGVTLAYKLHILKVMPVQYKYFYKNGNSEIRKIGRVCEEDFKNLINPVLLVVENNRCFGDTSKKAILDLKRIIPESKILYAAVFNDYSNQDMPGAEVCFFGKLTNEARGLSFEEADKKGVTNKMSLFPWENLEEEWNSIQLKGFEYQDEKA